MQLDREVTVGVPHGPSEEERARLDAGLLPQLPARRGVGALARRDLPAGELPKTGQEPGRGPSLDEPAAPVAEDHERRPQMGTCRPFPAPRERPRVLELTERPASERDRAVRAVRADGRADGLAELHDRLGEIGGRSGGKDGGHGPLKIGPDRRGSEVALLPGPAGSDPEAVRLERDHRATERDRSHGPGDVRADSRQRFEFPDVRRHRSPVILHEEPGRGV